ncbi:MAG: 50S ribosomal protein L30 [Nitrospiria bacterium]
MAKKLSIQLRKSCIGRPEKHRRVISGLGLKRIRQVVVRIDSPEIRGMVRKVSHMIHVEEVE